MRYRLPLALFVLSGVFLASALLADCQCCGLNGSSGCDPDAVAESIISNCQNACSSNCVKLTPENCLVIKSQLGSYVELITNTSLSAYQDAQRIRDFAIQGQSVVVSAKQELQSAKTLLQQGNDAKSFLISARDSLISFSNNWHSVQSSGLGGFTRYVYVTNNFTGAYAQIGGLSRPVQQVGFIVPLIESAISAIDRREENDIPTAIQSIDQSLLYLNQLVSSGDPGGYLYNIEQSAIAYAYNLEYIAADGTAMGAVLDSFDCEPCGKGASSSDGGGGGGGSTQDFTPIVAAVNELQSRLDYWMNRFWDIMHKYFEDYNSADSPFEGQPSYGGYNSQDDNWFKRVEYLLYSMAWSGFQEESTETVPTSPDGYSQIDQKTDSIKQSADADKGQVSSILNASVGQFKSALQNLASRLTNFEPQGYGVLAGDILVIDNGVALSIDQNLMSESTGVGRTFSVVRRGFRVLWTFLVVALYVYGLFFFVRFVLKCVALMYKAVFDSLG